MATADYRMASNAVLWQPPIIQRQSMATADYRMSLNGNRRLFNVNQWQSPIIQCQSMPFNVNQCQSMPINANQCQSPIIQWQLMAYLSYFIDYVKYKTADYRMPSNAVKWQPLFIVFRLMASNGNRRLFNGNQGQSMPTQWQSMIIQRYSTPKTLISVLFQAQKTIKNHQKLPFGFKKYVGIKKGKCSIKKSSFIFLFNFWR